jgi:hypothetical protein
MGVSPARIQGIAAGTAASTENLAPRITRMARDAGCSHAAVRRFLWKRYRRVTTARLRPALRQRKVFKMSTVQEIKAAIKTLPDPDFRELSQAIDEMEGERFDRALEAAAQSGKLDIWLANVDADINAGRLKPLDEIIDNT